VTLIIKDFGTGSFYANQGCATLIRALQAKPGGARICYIDADLSESQMASLYAACDCLVHPYRGEGYGLPIAEAMACGKAVITTGAGAALDFASSKNAYLIPAAKQYLAQTEISGMETVSRPYWFEPDRDALQGLLKHVVNNAAEASQKGQLAARHISEHHTWTHAAQAAATRLDAVCSDTSAAITIDSLPMGSANFGLSALNGVQFPPDVAAAKYEDKKQHALAEVRENDWQHAIADLEACLKDHPNDWDALNALGVARFRSGDTASALDILRRGAAESPNPRDFHHNIAFVLLENADEPDILGALRHAIEALRISPEHSDIRRTLERARNAALQSARAILRRAGSSGRANVRRDRRYRSLMDAYRHAGNALGEAVGVSIESVQTAEAPKRAKISLLMIVKNEERFLRNCLESARDVVDEMVIVDTGSTDSTIAIAGEYGAKVVHHRWNDDFSEARNAGLAHATGDWGLWLDADEEIAPGCGPAFREAVDNAREDVGGFMVAFRNWLQSTVRDEESDMAVHHACRLFRLAPGVRFEGRIHEQNLRSLQDMGYHYGFTPGLTIDHFGYASEIMSSRNKHERFIRMLTREVEECPDPSLRDFHLFNLGNAYFTLGDMENTVKYLRPAAEHPDLKEEFTSTLFTELATALQQLGRPEEGLSVCTHADTAGLEQSGIEFARGYCLLHLLRYEEAESSFRKALRLGCSAAPMAQTGDRGTSSYKARYGLALALVGQERYREAEQECSEALRDKAGFLEARFLLAITFSRLNRLEEARRELLRVLEQQPDHESALQELNRISFEVGDYAGAVPGLEAAARIEPNDYQINARLAVCYEQTGRYASASAVYERLRSIVPDSAEVCVNMGRALALAGSDSEALACFVKAIEIDPGYCNAYFNAGDLLYRNAQYEDAANSYIAGLEVNPNHPSGFFVLGNCLFQTRNFAAAADLYRQELVRDANHDQARSNLDLAEGLIADNIAA